MLLFQELLAGIEKVYVFLEELKDRDVDTQITNQQLLFGEHGLNWPFTSRSPLLEEETSNLPKTIEK